MGPLSLSGSLFLGLLVFDFYHPRNGDLDLVGGTGRVGRIFGSNFDFFVNCFDVVLVMFFYPPTNRDLYLVGGRGGGAYFWVKF